MAVKLLVLALAVVAGQLSTADASGALTLGRWLLDNTNSRLLLPYAFAPKESEDIWTNGVELWFEAAGGPNPAMTTTTTTTTTTTSTTAKKAIATTVAAAVSHVQAAPAVSEKSQGGQDQWFDMGLKALQYEAAGSHKRLVKLLTVWMEHESEFETRQQISKQIEVLEDSSSFLQVAQATSFLQTSSDDDDESPEDAPVTLKMLAALKRVHAFAGAATSMAVKTASGTPADAISIPEKVGDFVPDVSKLLVTSLGGGHWVAVLPLASGVKVGKKEWRCVTCEHAASLKSAAAPQQSLPAKQAAVVAQAVAKPVAQEAGSVSLVLKPVYQEEAPKEEVATTTPTPQQPAPEPAKKQAPAMVDSAGPDENASHQTKIGRLASMAEGLPKVELPPPSHARSKSDWLNWKPSNSAGQVSAMMQQLGMSKGGAAASAPKADDSSTPAFAKDFDSDSTPSAAPAPPPQRVVSWASLVPKKLRKAAPAAPPPAPVVESQPAPQEAVAMPQMSVDAGMDQLKQMNPDSYNIVANLLKKRQAGAPIPGLTPAAAKPQEDPAIAALGQMSSGASVGAGMLRGSDSMAAASSSGGADASFSSSSFGGSTSSFGGENQAAAKPKDSGGDENAVNGLLEQVMKLTGKHVSSHHKHSQDSAAQAPAFMHDFDDDDSDASSSDSAPAPKVSKGWGDLIPKGLALHQDQDQQPAPAANAYANLLN